jgi:enoyl-CoA hydratase
MIRYERQGSLALITLDRPGKLNAINKAMIGKLGLALDEAERDDAVRAVVLSGAGRAFAAGFDLDMEVDTTSGKPDPAGVRAALDNDFKIITRFWDSPKPTLAAVHGYCLGSAMELAMACDITIASEECRFGAPEVRFGSGIVAMLAPWFAGPKRAKELLLVGDDRLTSADALAMGLVNRVVPTGEALNATLELANRIAANDALAVRLVKAAINRSLEIAGMREAMTRSLDYAFEIETSETAESREFNEILKRDGAKAAIAWRSARAAAPTTAKTPTPGN